jgi:hypothetical protein
MEVVRCPSLPAAINTEKGEDKRGGGRTENRGDQRKKKRKMRGNRERETENCLERNKVTETERRSNDRREEEE